ncbi:Clp protease ClpP [Bacteroides fragilis]|uniref:ATP-dependent Clp protease proteolytic subunit n=1 Tax=Bacteroides fragilis TaxID=817 RepID=A0A396C5N1_BACFG|nr:Clp protease ClpP [Bacteroides fragilis]RHH14383.1 Clp protease ClpP [Bacteroides fragilis]
MDIDTCKYIIGEARSDEVATIRFFGKVTEETTVQFNNEFDFLENVIRPSLIRVLINSEGGSVLYGMSTYSTIQNSKVDTECVIEGMAASMASIIWAAGKRSLMRDYGILMIHNPFLPESGGEEASDLVKAFTQQIETIYRKRFALTKEQIKAIMEGKAGKDGTFFDATAAVKAGIIPESNVLKTSKQLCDKVKNSISGIEDIAKIQNLMEKIKLESEAVPEEKTENKLDTIESTTLEQKDNNKHKNMAEERTIPFEYAAVAASLGMKEQFEPKDVMARISELISVEARLNESERKLSDAQTVIAGRDATIQNLQKDLNSATSRLTVFEQKEAEEKATRINKLVDDAIEQGKIDKETKPQWVSMAEANFVLAESTLNSIPVREQISKEIANDPGNAQAAVEAVKTAEEKMAEKVNAVVGEKFEFKRLE